MADTSIEWTDKTAARRVGCTLEVYAAKKAAGRLLDGREWNQYPELRAEEVL